MAVGTNGTCVEEKTNLICLFSFLRDEKKVIGSAGLLSFNIQFSLSLPSRQKKGKDAVLEQGVRGVPTALSPPFRYSWQKHPARVVCGEGPCPGNDRVVITRCFPPVL